MELTKTVKLNKECIFLGFIFLDYRETFKINEMARLTVFIGGDSSIYFLLPYGKLAFSISSVFVKLYVNCWKVFIFLIYSRTNYSPGLLKSNEIRSISFSSGVVQSFNSKEYKSSVRKSGRSERCKGCFARELTVSLDSVSTVAYLVAALMTSMYALNPQIICLSTSSI